MVIKTNVDELLIELKDLANLFGEFKEIEIQHTQEKYLNEIENQFVYKNNQTNQEKMYSFSFQIDEKLNELEKKSLIKKMLKNHLYLVLSKELGMTLPWGSLTGIRPTKLMRDMIAKEGIKDYLVPEVLQKKFYVSPSKAKLVSDILKNQKCIIRNDNLIDLYINIPICPSRCLYCSFISHQISVLGEEKVNKYLDCLEKELQAVKEIILKKSYIVRTLYIGGGTPSVLNESQLERLLKMLTFSVDEKTVECGRADTITEEKLDILKKYGVTRISINPQTFCQATLKRIGRNHTNDQILQTYSKALEKGFVVNMDIIAGLPKEKLGIFKKTVNTLIELYPHNITVHTLSVKKGAELKDQTEILDAKDINKMIEYAHETLAKYGYKPYYIYRQKNQLGGLENVGYFRDENICIFNIDSMEETNTVIGVGAGAMSKRVYNLENRIERQHNVKFINDYCERIDLLIEEKRKFYN